MVSVKNPKVSIVMATHNRAHSVRQTIENIFEQDYTPIELIVVNDGSSDETQQLLELMQISFSFIVEQNPINLGLQKSLNIGIERATGKYIARIDDHDKWVKKDKLSKQVGFLEKNPSVGLLGTAYISNGTIMLNPETDLSIRKQILFRCPFCHVTVLMRKSVIDRMQGYDETLPYSEDWDLWLRIGQYTEMANLLDVTTEVINEGASLSGNYFLRQLPINRKIIKKHFRRYPNSWKAILYHHFINYFFTIIPINGIAHRMMKKIFQWTFLSGK